MKRRDILIGVGIIMAVSIYLFAATPMHQNANDPDVHTGTSGAAAPITLDDPAYSVCVRNVSTSGSFSAKLNADADAIVLYAGDWFCTSDADGFVTSTVTITAVSGTPDYEIDSLGLR